jgi:hypothetical protein
MTILALKCVSGPTAVGDLNLQKIKQLSLATLAEGNEG